MESTHVSPTFVGSLRLYATEDGRLLSQQHLNEQPHRYRTFDELEAPARLRLSA